MNTIQRTYSPPWQRLTIAVVGGDEREQEICRLALMSGATVRAFGFPWPSRGIGDLVQSPDAASALAGANIALMPIPGIATDGSIFATSRIVPDAALLRGMAEGAHIILGRADAGLRDAAAALRFTLHEYEHDQELMLLRAPAIVEAAIRILIENTAITIHGARICVVGQGTIGTVLTRTLVGLGAHLTVAARSPVQRAAAFTMGAEVTTLEALVGLAGNFDVLVSTASAPVVAAPLIDRLPPHALIVDLAAPPGSCDLQYATKSGRKAVWARALGRRAPVTVGASQWSGIAKIIDRVLQEEANHGG
jgi:dipicolinate synthase subunit A